MNKIINIKAWKQLRLSLIAVFWIIAVLGIVSAVFWSIHEDEPLDLRHIFDLSFYYWVPALVWTILLGTLRFWFNLLNKWFPNKGLLLVHFISMLLFVPGIRFLSLYLDFSIKYLIGFIKTSPLEVVKSVIWVVPASMAFEMIYYVLVMFGLFWINQKKPGRQPPLIVLGKNGNVPLQVEDIDWLKADKNYVELYAEGISYRLKKRISDMEELLSPHFVRVHRSYIININSIKSFQHWQRGEYILTMNDRKIITSSRTYTPQLKKALGI